MAVILMATLEPAGTTTRPSAFLRSLLTRAVTTSPTLFFRELMESFIVAVMVVPADRVGGPAGGAGVGAGAASAGAAWATVGWERRAFGLGFGFGAAAAGAGSGAGAGAAVSAGASLSGFDESTGASWRSRLRLSVFTAACFCSPPRHAPAASTASAMSIVLFIANLPYRDLPP